MAKEDRPNIAFVTPWGTYSHVCIPFRLKNTGATFQRAMDHSFNDLIVKFMEDYYYDLTIHS
jgi:hypothetical protein